MSNSEIKLAVILVAGGGNRLGDYSKTKPKCLIEVGGRTLLSRMLNILVKSGVERTILVVGYESNVVRKTIGYEWKTMEIEYIENTEWATTNNIVSLNLAVNLLDEDFFLLEGDLIFTSRAFMKMLGPDRLAIDLFEPYMDGTVVTCDNNGIMKQMYLKSTKPGPHPSELLYKTVNIYSFKKSSFFNSIVPRLNDLVEKGYQQVYYEQAIADAVKDGVLRLKCVTFDKTPWYEIDTPDDLKRAKEIFSKVKE